MEHRIVKGISEGFHDASVSLVKYDGNAEILWCKQAERITRKKKTLFKLFVYFIQFFGNTSLLMVIQ